MPSRTALAMLLLALASPAIAQTDFKPSRGMPQPPSEMRPPASAMAGRPRVTAQVVIGETAPEFTLDTADGHPLKLSSLRAGWVALFFIDRREALPTTDAIANELKPLGVRVLAVSGEKGQTLARLARERPLSACTALSDPTGDVAALYGLWDSGHDAVRPGFVLISPGGNVRMAVLGQALSASDATRLVQYALTGQ